MDVEIFIHTDILEAERSAWHVSVSVFSCDFIFGGFCGQLILSPFCLKGWEKGVVFINGQNLGRYWNIGPQETLYLPGAWLDQGSNQVGALATSSLVSALPGTTVFSQGGPDHSLFRLVRVGEGTEGLASPFCIPPWCQ